MNHTTLGLHPRTAHIVITRTAFDRAYTHYLIRFHAELVVLSVDKIQPLQKGPTVQSWRSMNPVLGQAIFARAFIWARIPTKPGLLSNRCSV